MLMIAGMVLIVLADQLLKWIVRINLMPVGSVAVIRNVFHFTYCENTGAGFSVLHGHTGILIGITAVLIAAMAIYLFVSRPKSKLLCTALVFIIGGALGNLADRLFLGYVVDYLDFCLIGFPIFNLADIFVTVGAVLIVFWVLRTESKGKQND